MPQNVVQDPAGLEVFHFIQGVDAAQHLDLLLAAILTGDHQGQVHPRRQFRTAEAENVQGFLAGQLQALAVLVLSLIHI